MSEFSRLQIVDDAAARKRRSAESATAEPAPRVHPVVAMQAHLGNRQVSRLLAQREGAPGDELQMKRDLSQRQEDDELVEAKHDRAIAQRQDMPEEDELPADAQAKHDRAIAQREEMPEEEVELKRDPALRRAAEAPAIGLEGGAVDDDMARRIDSQRGGGSSLNAGIKGTMESALGVDLGGVRVHQNAESDSLNRAMTAKAFTTGSDVFLRGDQNANDTSLLAHELTHVVQQSSGAVGGGPQGMTVGAADDPHEHEADEVANAVTSGRAVPERKVDETGG